MSGKAKLLVGDSWYFRARRRVLARFVSRHLPQGSRVLDVGCGDGWLAELLPGHVWCGVEPDPVLRQMAEEKGVAVLPSGAEKLPYPDGSFGAVCFFDVLEHLQDDARGLQEARRVLKRGGLLFVSVPLHPELWSAHDAACGHFRRYRKGELALLLGRHGFRVIDRRFFVSLPLPLVWLARRMGGGGPEKLPACLDWGMELLLLADAALNLSFGLTEVLAAEILGRKPLRSRHSVRLFPAPEGGAFGAKKVISSARHSDTCLQRRGSAPGNAG